MRDVYGICVFKSSSYWARPVPNSFLQIRGILIIHLLWSSLPWLILYFIHLNSLCILWQNNHWIYKKKKREKKIVERNICLINVFIIEPNEIIFMYIVFVYMYLNLWELCESYTLVNALWFLMPYCLFITLYLTIVSWK